MPSSAAFVAEYALRNSLPSAARRHVNNAPEPRVAHPRQQRLHTLHRATDIERPRGFEFRERLLSRSGRAHNTYVVDKPRNRASGERLIERGGRLPDIHQVGDQPVTNPADHDSLVAIGNTLFCAGSANTGCATCYENAFRERVPEPCVLISGFVQGQAVQDG